MRLNVIFFVIVFNMCSYATQLYGSEAKKELPSIYAKDYGSIDYDVEVLTLHEEKMAGYDRSISSAMDEKAQLTKFWAQEAVFAPETRELLQDMERRGFRFSASEVGVIDGGFFKEGMQKTRIDTDIPSVNFRSIILHEGHGTKVSNLITGEAPVGVSSKGKITMLKDYYDIPVWHPFGAGNENPPPVINASTTIYNYSYKVMNELLDKTILVRAAGNDFPGHGEMILYEFGRKMIVVGSLDPSGFVSHFSQSHENVIVLAPSDYYIVSRRGEGTFVHFGGTSGAAPLVSGAIADLRSVLPDVTRDEVATLLAKTATPTAINTVSNHDGAGTLNQYKLLRVALRLSENGWPHNRASLIVDEKMYDFADEAQRLSDEAEALLKTTNEGDYEAGFKKLRTAFALDTSNAKTRTMLANIYRDAGYSQQALFYDVPERSALDTSIIKKKSYRIYGQRLLFAIYFKSNLIAWNKLSGHEHMFLYDNAWESFIFSRQSELHNNPIIAKHAQKKGVSIAKLWKKLHKLVKTAP